MSKSILNYFAATGNNAKTSQTRQVVEASSSQSVVWNAGLSYHGVNMPSSLKKSLTLLDQLNPNVSVIRKVTNLRLPNMETFTAQPMQLQST